MNAYLLPLISALLLTMSPSASRADAIIGSAEADARYCLHVLDFYQPLTRPGFRNSLTFPALRALPNAQSVARSRARIVSYLKQAPGDTETVKAAREAANAQISADLTDLMFLPVRPENCRSKGDPRTCRFEQWAKTAQGQRQARCWGALTWLPKAETVGRTN